MSGFRALSEQYPMVQNYSPFKYVTLIFQVIAELHFAPNGCYDLSFKSQLREAKVTSHIRSVIRERCCLVSLTHFPSVDKLSFENISFLQLAVSSSNDGVYGNSVCDSAQHSHCTDEYNLHTGQESRPSGI